MLLFLFAPLDLKVFVTKPHRNGTIKEGDSVNLTCMNSCDSGNFSSAFTWFKDREPIHKGPMLNLSNISFTNSGNYTCSLTRHKRTTSGVININVECEYWTQDHICRSQQSCLYRALFSSSQLNTHTT